ncbi:PEPxxWA-CTERM sorting domain-containing protein [Sphingomonas sp. A2-49]|uniref:PEPxxWA-CTERM sorting domain-containing protein n=1 Tax=Sphingomonas sp. A2-49 TaxID=1391375 RepID=UPI0021CF5DBF|nr:PEPxxWA-CTERM sorting domain-containing protein [Sphingomonas sp. A2-49]MCU6454379.1 PEPxxWA-CTERM sorting domain-containing protein [Sphingomonas sp. A2-49]
MKTLILGLALVPAAMAATPAAATVILPGQTGMVFTPLDTTTRGTLLSSTTQSGTAATISGTVAEAVYRNTFGTLDFYFQVFRTGGTAEIDALNVSSFAGYLVDAFTDGTDFDGAGPFATVNNPTLADGTPSGSTTRVGRSNDGSVMRVDFGLNGLTGSENSTTYIFRTNAINFAPQTGNATVSNGTSFNVLAPQPIGPAVPEPATWAMMILGMASVGYAARRNRSRVATRVRFG